MRRRGSPVGMQRRGLAQTPPAGNNTLPSISPYHRANPPKSLDPPKRHEPAKALTCADGRAMLRGVSSTSDLEKYAGDLPLHSRTGAQTRIAFKTMRNKQQ